MRRMFPVGFSILLLLPFCSAQDSTATQRSILGEVVARNQNGEPAVLPGAKVVLHGPVTWETKSNAQGAFAIDGLPPGTYQIEANAPGLYAAVALEFANKICELLNSFEDDPEIFLTEDGQKWLTAMECASRRKVFHA